MPYPAPPTDDLPADPAERRDKLQSRDKALREEEHEKRTRLGALTDIITGVGDVEPRDLTPDELTEQKELDERCGKITEQRNAIKRSLNVGPFSDRLNDSIGLSDDEQRRFSFGRLIAARARDAEDEEREAAKMELEACRAYAKQVDDEPRGLYMPPEVYGSPEVALRAAHFARIRMMILSPSANTREQGRALLQLTALEMGAGSAERNALDAAALERRDLSAVDFGHAGALVGVDWRPQLLVELLRNRQALPMLGATMLPGLVGDVAIPRQTGAGVPRWVRKDGGNVGETELATGQITMEPKTIGAYTDITRLLRLQSRSVAVENLVRSDLMTELALAEDRAVFLGSGSNGEPLGLKNITGVGSVTATNDPSLADMIGHRKAVAVDNALMGNLAYVTESNAYSNMMVKFVDPGSGVTVMDKLPYPIAESNQIPDGDIFFGNWSEVMVGEWGMLDMLVDPYSRSIAGALRIVLFHTCDVAVRHPESFSIS